MSLHQSDPLSDTFFCDIVVNHQIIKRACLSQLQSGMIAEYLKALEKRDVHNLRMLLNEVLRGGCIPNEWKESRVVLVTSFSGMDCLITRMQMTHSYI